MKQDIRLIAMDLDGTALNSKKELTGRTRDAIEQAVKQGIHVVVATGRTFSSLAPAVLELKELSCAITSNGAVINQIPDGQILHADYLSAEAVWKITKMAETEKVDTEACTGGSAYIGQDYYDKVLAGKSGRNITYVKTTRHPVPDIYEFMTGIKYLNFIADIFKVDADTRQERIRKYADIFEITDDLGQPIAAYSHGMKQKLAIISAWLHNPKLIIMDEPFVGLDPKASHLLKEMMREFCDNGGAIFFSTHVLEVAEKLCDKVAIIKGGRLIKSGTMEEVKGDDSLEDVFLELEDE